jgi:teichoic acid transport system permease protein
MTAPSRVEETDFEPVYHRYGPHRAGLPPIAPYVRELWHRRGFATEMSKATMRGANTTTFFGQAWLVLNPLLLAAVYYLLVAIIRREQDPTFFAHLTLSLFAFNMVSTSITTGATSVTGSGKLLINTAFPRLLIPLAAVRTAFFRFLPTIPVYFVFHIIFLRDVWHFKMLLALYFLAMMIVFSMGLAAFFATLQVYFRDTSSFLPFFVRIKTNPMYSMLAGYAELLQTNTWPPTYMWLTSAAWAIGVAAIGFLFFMSRERDFAVRLD